MFERYTEKARRVIFFARYEASQFGSPYIETEHLLLGLLREDKALTNRFLRADASVESIVKTDQRAHRHPRENCDQRRSAALNEGKRVLAYAAEEAKRLGHKHIGTEHLLLGLLREEKCFAAQILAGARPEARIDSRRTRSRAASERAGRRRVDHHGQRQARPSGLLARRQWGHNQAPGILRDRSGSRGWRGYDHRALCTVARQHARRHGLPHPLFFCDRKLHARQWRSHPPELRA